jgi:hypothetical protein
MPLAGVSLDREFTGRRLGDLLTGIVPHGAGPAADIPVPCRR